MYCLLAFVFFFATIFTMLFANTYKDHTKFLDSLSPKLHIIYNKIKQDRRNIATLSSIIGVVLSIVVSLFLPKSFKFSKACIISAVYFVTQYLIYSLYPKGPLMVTYLNEEKQRKAWSDIYYHMKTLYIMGGIFGALGYFFLNMHICGCK